MTLIWLLAYVVAQPVTPDTAVSQVSSLCSRLAAIDREMHDAERRGSAAARDLATLEDEKKRALDELRSGMYCSKCKRPASQIQRETGQGFEQHLENVKGTPVPAEPEVVAAKEQEYNRQIASKRQEATSMLERALSFQTDLSAAQKEATNRILEFHDSTNRDGYGMIRRHQIQEAHDQRGLASLRLQIRLVDGALGSTRKASEQRTKDLQTVRTRLRAIYADADKRAQGHKDRDNFENGAFETNRHERFVELQKGIKTCDIPMLMSPAYTLFPETPLKLDAGDLSLTVSADTIEAGQSFGGGFGSSVKVSDDWFKSEQALTACLETPAVIGCLERRTFWQPLVNSSKAPSDKH